MRGGSGRDLTDGVERTPDATQAHLRERGPGAAVAALVGLPTSLVPRRAIPHPHDVPWGSSNEHGNNPNAGSGPPRAHRAIKLGAALPIPSRDDPPRVDADPPPRRHHHRHPTPDSTNSPWPTPTTTTTGAAVVIHAIDEPLRLSLNAPTRWPSRAAPPSTKLLISVASEPSSAFVAGRRAGPPPAGDVLLALSRVGDLAGAVADADVEGGLLLELAGLVDDDGRVDGEAAGRDVNPAEVVAVDGVESGSTRCWRSPKALISSWLRWSWNRSRSSLPGCAARRSRLWGHGAGGVSHRR